MEREGLHLKGEVDTEGYDQNIHVVPDVASIQRDAKMMFDITNQQLQKGSEPQNSLECWNSPEFIADVIEERKREKALLEQLTATSSEIDTESLIQEAEGKKVDPSTQPDPKDATLQDLDFSPAVEAQSDEILRIPRDADREVAIARIVVRAIRSDSDAQESATQMAEETTLVNEDDEDGVNFDIAVEGIDLSDAPVEDPNYIGFVLPDEVSE